MYRIDIIRKAIEAEGGQAPERCGTDYYADGPLSGSHVPGRIKANETIYKVPKERDGLTVEAREQVVDSLRLHPDVKDAYLSRPYRTTYFSESLGRRVDYTQFGHLKVVFDGTAY